jgi:hypothetical protein
MNNYFFVLGAKDPEMQEIARVLDEQNILYGYASVGGAPVRTSEAYKANGVNALIPRGSRIVFVECDVIGLFPEEICDHHNEGDPGFGMPPERYMEGSSLGQVLKLLGLTPTHEQQIIAAADHCLRHAYAGRCPGVTPKELADWRERSRAALREISVEELRGRIDAAIEALKKAPRIRIADEDVAFFSAADEKPEEMSEASARTGIPFCYVKYEVNGINKSKIMSAAPRTIKTWMRECKLKDVYGDPERGFAGGYL